MSGEPGLRIERDRLLRQLIAIRASTAWRLALPLRWMEARFPSLLNGATFAIDASDAAARLHLRTFLTIGRSGLFDSAWYITNYRDTADRARGPLSLWLSQGCAEGHDPHPLFSLEWYLARNPDVREAGINPLLHYIQHGGAEDRDPHPLFAAGWYLNRYPDVHKAGINPLIHYLRYGGPEGRDPHPLFAADWYLSRNPELREAGINPLLHYLQTGGAEGRDPHPLFAASWYLDRNPDARKTGGNPLLHYIQHGGPEGIDPHPLFAAGWYLERHPHVRKAGINPLLHYLQSGAKDGPDPSPLFSASWYLAENPDVEAAVINPLLHYVLEGAAQGRNPNPRFISALRLDLESNNARAARITPLLDFLERMQCAEDGPRNQSYAQWVRCYDTPHRRGLDRLRTRILALHDSPLVSIIVTPSGQQPATIEICLASVLAQVYQDWELCIRAIDSASTEIRALLEGFRCRDPRVKVDYAKTPCDEAQAKNQGIAQASGEYLLFLDPGACLSPNAVAELALAMRCESKPDILYADEDRILPDGRRDQPFFKPDWSPTLYRQRPYTGVSFAVRSALLKDGQGFDGRYGHAQTYELWLRLTQRTQCIHHVAKILVHDHGSTRDARTAQAEASALDPYYSLALTDHLTAVSVHARIRPGYTGRIQLTSAPRRTFPLISILIPTRGPTAAALNRTMAWLANTGYPSVEVIVGHSKTDIAVDGAHPLPGDREDGPPVHLVHYEETIFNAARAYNQLAKQASGDYLLMTDGVIDAVSPDWLESLLFEAEQLGVGAAGPRLIGPNKRSRSAGCNLGLDGPVGETLQARSTASPDDFWALSCAREVSVLSGRCILIRQETFRSIGGFCEHFTRILGGEDLCMRLREAGYRLILQPAAVVCVTETVTATDDDTQIEQALFLDRWEAVIESGDPFYNPNLNLISRGFGLAFPPR